MKQLNLLLVLMAPLFLFLTSCKEAPGTQETRVEINMDSVRAEINELESRFAAASNAKDVDGVAAYYASDAQSMAPGEPTWVGMDAIKAGIKKDMDSDTTGATVAFTTTGVWAGGDYATETGTIKVTGKDGSTVYTGKYMTLFELKDGKYVAIRDIWNSDAPERPVATPLAQ